ncbi:transcription factor HIVEP2 [Scleropages formosus]|uniref:HIVEP zinc finger 2 n=1 Tax=Scleropages formosus TaxID=113540 RepID=A0A8C9RR33_SCLFO|nr:transcription factor HIVEP2-like [Scleropages formosus]
MEPPESAVGLKYSMEAQEKKALQSVSDSEPNISSKRSTFADSKRKGHLQSEELQRCIEEEPSGKKLSSAVSRSCQEKQGSQRIPRTCSYRLRHSNPLEAEEEAKSHAEPEALQPATPEPRRVFPRRNSSSVSSSFSQSSQVGTEKPEDVLRKESKSKKPGKYICHYCGRACAKPSVLKKHIRSHTGERPYPCVPCGFSFKTKSNLYKHKKSHAHNIKAGLAPFSELASACKSIDQGSLGGEAEINSDYEQSTDTDEETAVLLDKNNPVQHIQLRANKIMPGGELACTHPAAELRIAPKEVPTVFASEQIIPSTAADCPLYTDIKMSPMSSLKSSGEEFPTIKQKLALRLTGKNGQDSEPSMNLLSPHSKGSTDSGYFSRSESAEQQISPPNTSAKSYEEIMFGKFYRLGPRSRQAIAAEMPVATGTDINIINLKDKPNRMPESGMGEISECHKSHHYTKDSMLKHPIYQNVNTCIRDDVESQTKIYCDPKQYPANSGKTNVDLVESVLDTGLLVRSNSVPTSPTANLDTPLALQASHSFDERMTSDGVFYRSSAGLRRLRRQAAFELVAQEGNIESGSISKNVSLSAGSAQLDESCPSVSYSVGVEGFHDAQVQAMHQKQVTETATRKRRKKKSIGDEEDITNQHGADFDGSTEMQGSDYDSKENQDTFRSAPTGKGQLYSMHRESDSSVMGTSMASDITVFVPDSERKVGGNVISVIQHTNSLSRPGSFEKSDSVDQPSYAYSRLTSQYSEQSDSDKPEEVQILNQRWSGSLEQTHLRTGYEFGEQQGRMLHKLVRQANIQVPEIRVTEEPDKPERGPDAPMREPERVVEEFQWPQRSETLSQLPAEKLPPKKKRLRLAEMEHSSGESSFESTCTSLSRSPSQESNLSYSSSFSMSFDREESSKSASPARQDDFGKQPEFLAVPGSGRSPSARAQPRQKEVRRSSSEQGACSLTPVIPEIRSKSLDYGGLSVSPSPGDIYTSALTMKERRRGYLIRQAPLNVHPEYITQHKGFDINDKERQLENSGSCQPQSTWRANPSALTEKPRSAQAHDSDPSKKGEDSHQIGLWLMQKTSHLFVQQGLESERLLHEFPSQAVTWYPSLCSNVVQSSLLSPPVWQPSSQKGHQASHAQQQSAQGHSEKAFGSVTTKSHHSLPRVSPWNLSDLLSKAFSTNTGHLEPVQTIFASHNAGSQPPFPSTSVPVRTQTPVPSCSSVMYTTVSQIVVTHSESISSTMVICKVTDNHSQSSLMITGTKDDIGFCLPHILDSSREHIYCPSWNVPEPVPGGMKTGIPLTLTSRTISTTDASSTGGNKRILSPANSLELIIETKQQKRVKEEKMYGQIVEELSAVELSNSGATKGNGKFHKLEPKHISDVGDGQEVTPSSSLLASSGAPLHLSEPYFQEMVDTTMRAESPENLEVDEISPASTLSASETQEEINDNMDSKTPLDMLVEIAANRARTIIGSTILLTHSGNNKQFTQFPSLRTSTSVSWCFLNYTKPNIAQMTSVASVYGSWFVSSHNPNPPDLNTKTTLALLCSKQRKTTESYTTASMYDPGSGKVVSSLLWKHAFDQGKPELKEPEVSKSEKKLKESGGRDRTTEVHKHKEVSSKQAEPSRIKIFEGGYKSNEDYVYVRGRGRGKYICEECGIRCKKPSMLKKHIRTHTDVRPYVCKFCNFAFKTKGNLTKHMKSKAHMKKCMELGVSLSSVETVEVEEADNTDDGQTVSWKMRSTAVIAEHQFSDADDSDGAEEEGDENDEDDDEDDEYDGDSTPRTRSRSTSPQPCGTPCAPVTASAASQRPAPDLPGPASKKASFFSLPSIEAQQKSETRAVECQRTLQGALSDESWRNTTSSSDKLHASSVEFSPGLPSPGCDSSPQRESSPAPQRCLCPSRELPHQGTLRVHVSPKKNTCTRRGLSPRGHPSCASLPRPVSPGKDITYRRELSPRSRHKGAIRPVSPRRGTHHHSAPWGSGQHLHSELPPYGKTSESSPEVDMDPKKNSQTLQPPVESYRGQECPGIQQGLFSHLPPHSRLQVHTLVPVVPIGGIQIVHAVPPSAASPLGGVPSEPSPSRASSHLSCEAGSKALGDTSREPEEAGAGRSRSPQESQEDMGDTAEKADTPDESVQSCVKAIASLRISSGESPAQPPSELSSHPHPASPETEQVKGSRL